jgi:hypothetical protein
LLGQGLLWRSLGRSLLANAVLVRLGLRLGLGDGSPSRLRPQSTVKITPFVRYAAINKQKTRRCGMPSLLRLKTEKIESFNRANFYNPLEK